MNTLNYKALFIRTAFVVFIRAIGIYLLITLPVLGIPIVYLTSAVYAASFGWIAGAVFMLVMYVLQGLKATIPVKMILLYTSVAAAVAAAYEMMEVLGAEQDIWQTSGVLIFPAAAVAAGWISLAVSKKTIQTLIKRAAGEPGELVFRKKQTAAKYFLNKVS